MKLPEIFQLIIDHDKKKPTGKVVDLKEFTEWLKIRRGYSRDAERFIERQKGP